MPYKEKEIEKLYYTIGEVAQLFGVNTSHIRFWSNEFDVIRPATNKKGNRLYTREDIDNFRKIYHLVKEKGFTLKGAKTELKDMRQRVMIEASSNDYANNEILLEDSELPSHTEISISAPIDQDTAIPALSRLYNGDFVDRMAIKGALEKIRTGLLDLRSDLNRIAN